MKNAAFHFSVVFLSLLNIIPAPKNPASPESQAPLSWSDMRLSLAHYNCISGSLDNISGNTYAIKFKNGCDDDYRVYYQVIDGGKVIMDTNSVIVRAHSENSSGTVQCSANSFVKIIKEEPSKS